MIPYVVYSNTEYVDILEIQTDHITVRQSNCVLFINKNDLELDAIYSKYSQVCFYNDKDSYATRLHTCIGQLDFEYFVLLHDIDVLIHSDNSIIDLIHQAMLVEKIDRVDLKYTDNLGSSTVYDLSEYVGQGVFLVRQEDIYGYIYNVNPSIWKKSCLLQILSNFLGKNYRNIEDLDVQIFCKQFNIYKIHTDTYVDCGHFSCVDFFKYFHISHGGKLVPLNTNYTTVYGQPYVDVKDYYVNIVDKYNLKNSKKWNN